MSQPLVLRQRSGPVITVVVLVFLALLLGDALIRGAWATVLAFLAPLAFIGYLVYLVLWRPCLILTIDHVEIREVLSTAILPYTSITDVRLGPVVAITAAGADRVGTRTFRPWNAPGTPRRKLDSGLQGGRRPESLAEHPSVELLNRWQSATNDPYSRTSSTKVLSQWNALQLTVLGTLLIFAIISLTLH